MPIESTPLINSPPVSRLSLNAPSPPTDELRWPARTYDLTYYDATVDNVELRGLETLPYNTISQSLQRILRMKITVSVNVICIAVVDP